jgi:hypothetical protein
MRRRSWVPIKAGLGEGKRAVGFLIGRRSSLGNGRAPDPLGR